MGRPGGDEGRARRAEALLWLCVVLIGLGALLVWRGWGSEWMFIGVVVASMGAGGLIPLVDSLRFMADRTVPVRRVTGATVLGRPTWSLVVGVAVVAVGCLSLVWLWWHPELADDASRRFQRGVYGLPLLAVAWLGYEMWRRRLPDGLHLDDWGITGIAGGPLVAVPWESLESVTVVDGKNRRDLVIVGSVSGAVRVPEALVGGDALAVATVIRYFAGTAEHRHLLDDGVAAVRHVSAEVAAGRFEAEPPVPRIG